MKLFINPLSLFFFFFLVLGQATAADTTYVWARSGLNLRKSPDFKGEKIITLPYGTLVEVSGYAQMVKTWNELSGDDEQPVVVKLKLFQSKEDTASGYVMSGHWVKVRANGQQGFLYDGYLSGLPPIKITKAMDLKRLPTVEEGLAALREYVAQTWGSVYKKGVAKEMYSNGAVLDVNTENPQFLRWVIPDTDGFLMANFLLALEQKHTNPGEEKFETTDCSAAGFEFEYRLGIDNMILYIHFCNGLMVIETDAGSNC